MNRHQLYNKYKRDQEAKQFYNSDPWETARTLALIRDFYLCQECLKNKIIRAYDVVHHIKPRRLFPQLALVLSNLICLCHACHNKIENELRNGNENSILENKKINFIDSGANKEIF